MINDFCKDCIHRKVPETVRDKFDNEVFELFSDCPLSDKRIAGCVTKHLHIEWANFCKFLNENKKLTPEEKKEILNSIDRNKSI